MAFFEYFLCQTAWNFLFFVIQWVGANHNNSSEEMEADCRPIPLCNLFLHLSCTGMSLARPCLWAGRRPVWRFWAAPCCAAPALKTTCEGSNITANHSLPQPGSTCKTHPLPAATQTESIRHAWHHPLLLFWQIKPAKTKQNNTKRLSRVHTCNQIVHWTFIIYEQTTYIFHVNHPANI